MSPPRLRIVYVLDSAGTARAGGLVSGDRIIEGLRERHDVVSVGLNGDVKLPRLKLPFVEDLVEANSFAFARPDGRALRAALEGADVVHLQLPFFLGFRALALARDLGVPVVTAHHVQPENVFAQVSLRWPHAAEAIGGPTAAQFFNRLMVKTFHQRADLVICPTAFARDELLAAGLTVPTAIISNGAPPRFHPGPRPTGDKFAVLSVGRLVPEKRHDVILDAVRQAKHASEMRVVIAGKGPLAAKLSELALGHPAEVHVGFVSDDELLRLYQTADVYVHASEVELEGMTTLEAMRCGCPTLVADSPASATRQFALDRRHLFTPGDAYGLAQKLDRCFEDRTWLERERGRTLDAVHELGLPEVIAAYERAYLSVVRHEATAPPLPELGPSRPAA